MAFDPTAQRSVGEAFLERLADRPEAGAVTLVRDSGAQQSELTYAALSRRAAVRAMRLSERLLPGDRVLIVLPTSLEFVEVYLGCMLSGAVAVPVPAPGGSAVATERVLDVIRDCRPALAVCSAADHDLLVSRLQEQGLESVLVEIADDVSNADCPASSPGIRLPGSDSLAVLQYSSGTTGSPKGVMLFHRNILANLASVNLHCGFGPDDRIGTWLPLHHDMGLFGQLTAGLVFGAPVVMMPPTEFVRRPIDWLRLLHRHSSTVTGGPSFAYDLCARVISEDALDGLDLSALRVAFNGSEPIDALAMERFAARFARIGIRPDTLSPCYGLAEATLFVTTNRIGLAPTVLNADPEALEAAESPAVRALTGPGAAAGRALVGVGTPGALAARIVDPDTRRQLPAEAVGEIWLRGASIGSGYFGRPELSGQLFQAELADDPEDAGGWLRTGDLGAFVDGELFVTGRIKELLVLNGRNLAPQDVERQARAAHPALTGLVGAAFTVAAHGERAVLVHEVDPRTAAPQLPDVADAVIRHLTRTFGVSLRNVLLVRRGTVPRTTSGKIRRGQVRARFLAGEIAALHSALEPELATVWTGAAA